MLQEVIEPSGEGGKVLVVEGVVGGE